MTTTRWRSQPPAPHPCPHCGGPTAYNDTIHGWACTRPLRECCGVAEHE